MCLFLAVVGNHLIFAAGVVFLLGRKENIQGHTRKGRKGEGVSAAEQLQLTSDPKGKKTIAVHKANNAILN